MKKAKWRPLWRLTRDVECVVREDLFLEVTFEPGVQCDSFQGESAFGNNNNKNKNEKEKKCVFFSYASQVNLLLLIEI